MATGVKAAAFAALVRVLMEAFPSAIGLWQPVVAGAGDRLHGGGEPDRPGAALAQAHAGVQLDRPRGIHAGGGLDRAPSEGAGAVLFYLLAYGLTTLASFGFLAALGRGGERDVTYDDIAGLAPTRPWIALGLSVCMLSLLGFPGTIGFIGKWYILTATVAEGQMILPVILVLTSVLSAGYYLPGHHGDVHEPGPGGRASRGRQAQPHGGGADHRVDRRGDSLRTVAQRAAGHGDLQRAAP